MAQALLTPAQVDDIVARCQAGKGIAALATLFDVHRNTVTKHWRRRGARRPRGSSDAQAGWAIDL